MFFWFLHLSSHLPCSVTEPESASQEQSVDFNSLQKKSEQFLRLRPWAKPKLLLHSFLSGGPDQLGPSQEDAARHGEVQPGPGQRGDHAEPHGLRSEGQRPLPAAAPLLLLPLCQRGGQHGRQLRRRSGAGPPVGDEVEDGAGGVRGGPPLPDLRRPGLPRHGAALWEHAEDEHHPGEGLVPWETPLCDLWWAGGTHPGKTAR